MKVTKTLPIVAGRLQVEAALAGRTAEFQNNNCGHSSFVIRHSSGFTLVEIAICLAIIGIALVGIIGVLPIGLNTQRYTREETIINQDVAVLMPIITQGARGADDLTNYVYAITNNWTFYPVNGTPNSGVNGYTANSVAITSPNALLYQPTWLTNGARIVGLLSTPEYVADIPIPNTAIRLPLANLVNIAGYSNHITAYIRSMSGLASEKPPQNNDIVVGDSFSYQIVVVNSPVALDTNTFDGSYSQQLWLNQREVRMFYRWPQLPNGRVGTFSQNFRATVAGQLVQDPNNLNFYYYQPQSFGVNTN